MTTPPPPAPPPAPSPPPPPPRRRRRKRAPVSVGAAPGTLDPGPDALPLHLDVIVYGAGRAHAAEKQGVTVAEIEALRRGGGVVWVDATGTADVATLRALGELFGLHRLALEDVVNVRQRAKVEDYGEHAFLVLRMIDTANPTETEQFAMFVGADFLVTFQERPGDCFQALRQRLRDPSGQIQKRGADYLAYALLDSVVDAYFPVLERHDERLEAVEVAMLAGQDVVNAVPELHGVRRGLLELRRAVWPLREATSSLMRGDGKHFSPDIHPYLRDVHDHVVLLLDLLENYREMTSSLLDLHLSMVNHRLNEVIKLLTVISTIFIPLTFVVGVYGMNFDWMPELKVWWGYPACLLAMGIVAVLMLRWFRRRGWV